MHIMVDIETLGLHKKCAIVSIGAVVFDPRTGVKENIRPFHEYIDIDQHRRDIDAKTLLWWLSQPEDTVKQLTCEPRAPLDTVLGRFSNWISQAVYDEQVGAHEEIFYWSRSVAFDFRVLSNAFATYNMQIPWKYYQLADQRTFDAIVPREVFDSIAPNEQKHNALSDCMYQIEAIKKAMSYLKTGEV